MGSSNHTAGSDAIEDPVDTDLRSILGSTEEEYSAPESRLDKKVKNVISSSPPPKPIASWSSYALLLEAIDNISVCQSLSLDRVPCTITWGELDKIFSTIRPISIVPMEFDWGYVREGKHAANDTVFAPWGRTRMTCAGGLIWEVAFKLQFGSMMEAQMAHRLVGNEVLVQGMKVRISEGVLLQDVHFEYAQNNPQDISIGTLQETTVMKVLYPPSQCLPTSDCSCQEGLHVRRMVSQQN